MCGIAGIWSREAPSDIRDAVRRMNKCQHHRGPDDAGVEDLAAGSGRLAIGCTRLAIQDLSPAGHMPMKDPASGSWITYNGEIYNFRELRVELEASGRRLHTGSDTEVILQAYAAWGTDALPRLRGMFALALWDQPAGRLILARDRLGVKPLYYTTHQGRLAFASEVRSLLLAGAARRELDLVGLRDYLALGAVQDPHTLLEDVRSLPAGHLAIWQEGELRLEEYWSLRDSFLAHRPAGTAAEEARQVRSLLEESVRLRMISDAPIGVFLSGGIDSGAVTALAARVSSQPVRTVSVVFREERYSEQDRIRRVAQRHATDHTELCLAPADLLRLLPEALAAMDQPTFDGVNTFVVSREARQAGLTVALSGVGGDELFGGYPSFARVPRLQQARRWLPRPARRPAAAAVRAGAGDDRTWKLSRWLGAGDDLDGPAPLLTRELFSPPDRARLAQTLNGVSPRLPEAEAWLADLDPFNQVSWYELTHYMRNVLLRDGDSLSMASSLEVREPLLDHRLVEHVVTLPGAVKLEGAPPKPLLRRANIEPDQPKLVRAGPLEVDQERHEVRYGDKRVQLRPKEFDLLALLARHPSRVFQRSELLDLVWGYDFPGYTRTVDDLVQQLREKLADAGVTHPSIHTVWGVGYKLEIDGS